jgi:hypothetical protein
MFEDTLHLDHIQTFIRNHAKLKQILANDVYMGQWTCLDVDEFQAINNTATNVQQLFPIIVCREAIDTFLSTIVLAESANLVYCVS